MDINQLRYFNCLAIIGNMSKAAAILKISQSTLSKSISRLESEIGCPLFDRKGRKITLNSSGNAFFEDSVRILEMLDKAIENAGHVHLNRENRIRICITGASKGIFNCITEYQKINPNVCFDIDSVLDIDEVPRITNYDLMICPDSPRYSIYPGTRIKSDSMALCVSRNHPYASRVAISAKDLNGLDIIFLRSNGVVESVQKGLEVLSIRPNKVYYVSNRELHRQMISEGIGAGFILHGASDFYASDDNIVIVPILDDSFAVKMKIVFRKNPHLSEEAKAFKDFVLDFLAHE